MLLLWSWTRRTEKKDSKLDFTASISVIGKFFFLPPLCLFLFFLFAGVLLCLGKILLSDERWKKFLNFSEAYTAGFCLARRRDWVFFLQQEEEVQAGWDQTRAIADHCTIKLRFCHVSGLSLARDVTSLVEPLWESSLSQSEIWCKINFKLVLCGWDDEKSWKLKLWTWRWQHVAKFPIELFSIKSKQRPEQREIVSIS